MAVSANYILLDARRYIDRHDQSQQRVVSTFSLEGENYEDTDRKAVDRVLRDHNHGGHFDVKIVRVVESMRV